MMNRSATQRSEEARRQAQSTMQKAKQAQSEVLKERAEMMAVEARKVDKLRTLRLAKEAEVKEAAAIEAALPKMAAPRKRRPAKRAAETAAVPGGNIESHG